MTDVAERLRIELLENLDRETSLDRIRQIISTPSQLDRRVALKILVKDVSGAVVNVFRGHVSIRVGRPTENSSRDRRIVIMKLQGKSYAQIAHEMGITRNAAQAAYRRYIQDPLYELENLSEDS
jgi:DNA-binding NarL/FixJ family response regulator